MQQDANFNVTALIDVNGNVVERYVYDPFGLVTIYNADWSQVRTSSAFAWKHFHQGLLYEGSVGLYDNRGRWYDPVRMRFIQVDPKGFGAGDPNLYRYEGNGPTGMLDPSGLQGQPGNGMATNADYQAWYMGFVASNNSHAPTAQWGRNALALADRGLSQQQVMAHLGAMPVEQGRHRVDWFKEASNFSAGMGDAVSFGYTRRIRQAAGYDDAVNYQSGYYTAGQQGVCAGAEALGGGADVRLAGSLSSAQQGL